MVSQRTSVRSTLGLRTAIVMPVMPPIDSPTKCVCVMDSASRRATTSSARSSKLYGPGATSVSPWPRLSYRNTRYRRVKASICASHMRYVVARELLMVTQGAPSGPSIR